jgi:hypothetical protein
MHVIVLREHFSQLQPDLCPLVLKLTISLLQFAFFLVPALAYLMIGQGDSHHNGYEAPDFHDCVNKVFYNWVHKR